MLWVRRINICMKKFDEKFDKLMERVFISSSLNYEDNIRDIKKTIYETNNKHKKRNRNSMLR